MLCTPEFAIDSPVMAEIEIGVSCNEVLRFSAVTMISSLFASADEVVSCAKASNTSQQYPEPLQTAPIRSLP